MSYNYLFKFIIVGDASVGKSCIASRFQHNQYSSTYEVTIGVEFFTKMIKINNHIIKIQIWDTAGQETYRSLTRSYFRGSIGCLLVFDITNRDSFNSIIEWLNNVKKNSNEYIVFILIGNKSDMINQRQVNYDEADSFAKKYNIDYIETSALNARNIKNAFHIIAERILDNISCGNIPIIGNDSIKRGVPLNRNFNIDKEIKQDDSCCF